ncbi:MAG: MarR family transcriptional regulator [Eggerthellaceae bacterium]|nr:MarR family transcriptional regulator [Eggerthellaceae bacterium]
MKDLSHFFTSIDAVHAFVRGGSLHVDDIMLLAYLGQDKQGRANTASGLSEALHLGRPRISRILARLSAAGLAQEAVQRSDYRVSHYRLSNHGENVLFEIRRRFGRKAVDDLVQDYIALQAACRSAEHYAGERKFSDSAVRIYVLLLAAKKPLKLSELIEASNLAQNRVSQAVAALERKGSVQLATGKGDARVRMVSLTAKGKAIAKHLSLRL